MPWRERRDVFEDRRAAGRALAKRLASLAGADALVLALPRGGVPVGYEVATALGAELDVLVVRKIGAEGHAEFGLGAVVDADAPRVAMNPEAVAMARPRPEHVEAETRRQIAELARRRATYRGDRPPPVIDGRTVIVVDDGAATGGTARAALEAVRAAAPARLILALPVAAPDAAARLAGSADEVVALATPSGFLAVGAHYRDFDQTQDDEVVALLEAARSGGGRGPEH